MDAIHTVGLPIQHGERGALALGLSGALLDGRSAHTTLRTDCRSRGFGLEARLSWHNKFPELSVGGDPREREPFHV